MSDEMLRIENLHAWYGDSHILHGLNLEVKAGEVVTLLGRNGAGRTTTLRAILGLTGERKGSIRIADIETVALRPHRIARLGVGYCPEERGIFASLSARENLLLPPVVGPGGMSEDAIYKMFPNLQERAASPGARLSGGGWGFAAAVVAAGAGRLGHPPWPRARGTPHGMAALGLEWPRPVLVR